jgi:transcriptional regulator with GAF, ATPase, and Fis domain
MKLDEQSFQNLLAAAFTIQDYNDRNFGGLPSLAKADERLLGASSFNFESLTLDNIEEQLKEAIQEQVGPGNNQTGNVEEPAELEFSPHVSEDLLREIVQQALQVTKATSAAIALKQRRQLTCLHAVGDAALEIRAMIESEAGFTGICAGSRTMQFCTNTLLDPRSEADSWRKIGIRALVFVPLLYEDQLLGLLSVFSRTPYAFGASGVHALQGLAQQFAANLQMTVEPVRVQGIPVESNI